jgi:adenosylcobinamide-phosphate synthase
MLGELLNNQLFMNLLVVAGALALDLILGDPVYRLHPIRLIGKLIAFVERLLFLIGVNGVLGGGILLVTVCGVVSVISLFLQLLPSFLVYICDLFLIYSSLSAKDLRDHLNRILQALRADDLLLAREKVQMVVGRDVQKLDKEGVTRAAIESMAESFVDGFLAPLFYLLAGGLIFKQMGVAFLTAATTSILLYKVINTLDSMVGYKSTRYIKFGKISAKTDDLFNLIPARLSVFLITVAAFISGFDAKKAWIIGWRDRLKHTSPNAGHAESALAGALKIRLGGTVTYSYGVVEKPWIGDGKRSITPRELAETMKLIQTATLVFGCGGWLVLLLLV